MNSFCDPLFAVVSASKNKSGHIIPLLPECTGLKSAAGQAYGGCCWLRTRLMLNHQEYEVDDRGSSTFPFSRSV